MMDHEGFQGWLAEADRLSARQREEAARQREEAARQREEAARVLAEPASLTAVLALVEARIDETRRCPHCAVEGR